jgi:hypothetical protein
MAESAIYILFDPREAELVRYVGKTDVSIRTRLAQHLQQARSGIQSYRCKWIRSLLCVGQQPRIRLIESVSKEIWQTRERFWIRYFRDAGHPLTNGSAGGDGNDSASWKAIWDRAGMRERQSVALSRYLQSESGRRQRSETSKRRWSDPAERIRQSERMKSVAVITRAARSVAATRSWTDPAIRERRIAGLRSGKPRKTAPPKTAAHRAAAGERSKQRWADPAFRVRAVHAMKLAHSSHEAHRRSSDAKKRGWISRRNHQEKSCA